MSGSRAVSFALIVFIHGACAASPATSDVATEAASLPSSSPAAAPATGVNRRESGQLVLEDVPEIPADLQARIRAYQNARSATFSGFAPGRGLLVRTRFGETDQLHRVAAPMGAREQLTFFMEPVGSVATSPTAERPGVVFAMDAGGSEYSQLFWLDVDTRRTQMLTDGASRNDYPLFSGDGRYVYYSSTERNQSDFDLWRIDTTTKERSLFFQGEGLWVPLDVAVDGARLLALRYLSATKTELVVVSALRGIEYRFAAEADSSVYYGGAVFNARGDGVYYVSDEGRQFTALRFRELNTGKDRIVSDPKLDADVVGITVNQRGTRLAALYNVDGFSRLDVYDMRRKRFLTKRRVSRGVIGDLEFTADGRHLAFTLRSPTTSGDVFVHDVVRNRTARWTRSELGGIPVDRLERFDVFTYPTFDEARPGQRRQIPGMILRPPGEGPFPVVVIIHGGPEAQARPTFSTYDAVVAGEIGAAVIRPNVRGSTGYGRAFTMLDNGERREDSVKDIGSLLDWIEAQPDLDASRVVVLGGSYGGYMVLASAVKYSDRLKAAIDIVGISSFVTFLEGTKAYRRDLRRVEYGDERDVEMRAFLESISPLNQADKIKVPLFVIQGANDPRVPLTESEQIVARVRAQENDVWYMLAKDEGHGFKKKANRDASLAAIFLFLKKYL